MAYEMVMPYHLHMPSYFLETFTEYPSLQRCWKNPANIANALTTLYNMSCYSTYKYNIDKSLSKHTAIC